MIVLFLSIILITWLSVASIQDIKKHEVQNFISFSFLAISLSLILLYSILNSSNLFFRSLLFTIVFFIIAEAFYYGRVFAGGDAKIILSLGPFMSLFPTYFSMLFIILLIFLGAINGIFFSFVYLIKNKKEVLSKYKPIIKTKYLIFPAIFLLIVPLIIKNYLLLIASILLIASPYILSLAKAIESSIMIRYRYPKELVEGDILFKPLKIKNRIIKPHWEGLTTEQLVYIKKNYSKKIAVKEGLAFVPIITLSLIISLLIRNLKIIKEIMQFFSF